jgi:hypothetical protein
MLCLCVAAGVALKACPVYVSFCGDEQPTNFELTRRDLDNWSAGNVQWSHSTANKTSITAVQNRTNIQPQYKKRMKRRV